MGPGASPGLGRLHDVLTRIHRDSDLDSVLQAIADGVVEVSGFRASAINVYLPETDEFELVAIGGAEPEFETHLHTRYPAAVILERSRSGEKWGLFSFISHTLGLDAPDGYMVLDVDFADVPGAWHPLDEISVELHAPTGELLGIMYVDRPGDGMLPSSETIAAMEIYAIAAGIALHNAQQRAADREEAWLGGMVRAVIDHLAGPGELSAKLDTVLAQLRTELQAAVSWLDVFGDVAVPGIPPSADQPAFTLVAALDSYGPDLALHATETGQAVVLDRGRLGRDHPLLSSRQRSWLSRALAADDVTSVALAPLDNDEELAGQLVLGRRVDRSWSTAELETLREIGRELGWALGRQRSRERERLAEEQLDQAARERRHLLNALAREITPHFTRLDTHMATLSKDDPARLSMEAFWSLVERVRELVAFERYDHRPRPTVIDMAAVLGVLWAHLAVLGRQRGVQVLPLDPAPEQLAWADAEELEWVVRLLTEDVVLRAPAGSAVRFGLVTRNHRLVLSCQVSGLENTDDPDDHDDTDVIAHLDEDDVDADLDPDAHVEADADLEAEGDLIASGARREPDPVIGVVPVGSSRTGPRIARGDTDDPAPWWQSSAQQLLARSDARLSTRGGPMGRRVVSLSLPVPHQR